MAYFSINSVNLSATTATQAGDWMWAIKTALKAAGWTVMGSGDGTSFQNGAATDYITSQSVANNNNAWIRLREPSGVGGREYLFSRGTASDRLLVKYSRSTGFTSYPAPTATTVPTTGALGDGVVWLGANVGYNATGTGTGSYDQAANVPVTSATLVAITPGYVSCVASDTPVNGTYGWWAFINTLGTGVVQYVMFTEGIDASTCSPLDYDPSVRQFASPTNQRTYNAPTSALMHYWQGYPSSWSSPTTATYRVNGCGMVTYTALSNLGGINGYIWALGDASGVQALSPYNGKSGLLPIFIYRAGAVVVGDTPKGFTSGIRMTYGPFNYCDTLDLTTSSPNITIYYHVVATSGIFGAPTASPWVTFPWVQNVVALF